MSHKVYPIAEYDKIKLHELVNTLMITLSIDIQNPSSEYKKLSYICAIFANNPINELIDTSFLNVLKQIKEYFKDLRKELFNMGSDMESEYFSKDTGVITNETTITDENMLQQKQILDELKSEDLINIQHQEIKVLELVQITSFIPNWKEVIEQYNDFIDLSHKINKTSTVEHSKLIELISEWGKGQKIEEKVSNTILSIKNLCKIWLIKKISWSLF